MINFSRIRAISLDLDDTLWPIEPVLERADKALIDWLGQHAPMTAAMFASHEARAEIRHHIVTVMAKAKPHLAHDLSALRLESIRLALYRAGDDPLLAERAFDVFYSERNRVVFYAHTLEALEYFSRRYPLIAVTNGNAQLDKIGLASYFQHVVHAREFGVGKPDIRIFKHAASLLGIAPECMLHAGDDAVMDGVGALNAGMQAAWINRQGKMWQYGPQRPTVEVASLAELLAVFGYQVKSQDQSQHMGLL